MGENAVPHSQADLSGNEISENGSPGKETVNGDSSYYITWTVHIALAFPPEEAEVLRVYEKGNRITLSKRNPEQGCYHIEYKLLPGDTETVKMDLVLFGPVAKLYKEEETEILKTWCEADQIWVAWTQNFKVNVNKAMAISLLSHKITVHIWNHKDKLFSHARFERQRVLRLAQDLSDDTEMFGGVKTMVNKMRSLCGKECYKNQQFNSTPKLAKKDKNMDLRVETDTSIAGMTSVEFRPVCFLADEMSMTNSSLVCSCGIIEAMINISLDSPLLSDKLKAELNPLAITILSAISMPSAPVPFHVLEEICMPVYCQYQFHTLNMHRTNYKRHNDKIYFTDVNVILIGLLNPQDLHKFLLGPPKIIEIHDRDRKLDDESPVGFGWGFNGDILRDTSVKRKTEDFNYHGVASLDFSELLFGRTNVKVCLPIKCCAPPLDMAASNQSIPPGHYLDANSELRVRIKLACPLNIYNLRNEMGTSEAQFGRIVYIFDCNNLAVMDKLKLEVLKSNAEAFDFGSHVLENIEKALSNYTTHFQQSQNQDLDFVTGFHVIDKKTQIVVVEGYKHNVVRRLWEAVPMKLSGSKEEQVIVLYNSRLAFFKRIYHSLDLGLRPIYLSESLEIIIKEPLLYIKGNVPQACLQALIRLKQLCQVRSLKTAVQFNLFPSADMILSLSRQYEMSTKAWRQILAETRQSDQTSVPLKSNSTITTTNIREYIHSDLNSHYVVFREPKDFIQENKRKVHEESAHPQNAMTLLRLKTADDRPAHNYSIQSLNSNELNKAWLQQQMAKMPGRRFTFCQEYHSMTVEPGEYTGVTKTKVTVDPAELFVPVQDQMPVLEAGHKPDDNYGYRSATPRRAWDSSINRCKMHPKSPHPSRVEELRKPWRENILHSNILKPPLSRDPFTWSQHSKDFQLSSKMTHTFPVSIYLAGDSLREEQANAARAEHSCWMKKLLGDPEFKSHMAKTDTFENILCDQPKKYSLRKPGMLLKPVPHLSVISHSGVATDVQRSPALAPGPRVDCRLRSRDNAIPRHSSEFNKYKYIKSDKKPSFLYKRAALPLTEEEKDAFTFRVIT